MGATDPNPYVPPAVDDLTAPAPSGREAERAALARSLPVLLVAYCAAGAMTVLSFLWFLIYLRTVIQADSIAGWGFAFVLFQYLLQAVLYALVWAALGGHRQAIREVVEGDRGGLEDVCRTHMRLWIVIAVWGVPNILYYLYWVVMAANRFH